MNTRDPGSKAAFGERQHTKDRGEEGTGPKSREKRGGTGPGVAGCSARCMLGAMDLARMHVQTRGTRTGEDEEARGGGTRHRMRRPRLLDPHGCGGARHWNHARMCRCSHLARRDAEARGGGTGPGTQAGGNDPDRTHREHPKATRVQPPECSKQGAAVIVQLLVSPSPFGGWGHSSCGDCRATIRCCRDTPSPTNQ